MHQHLSQIFLELFNESKQLTGHLEVIKGCSGETLEQVCDEWVKLAVSTIEELHEDVNKLITIVETCHEYYDSKQLQTDTLAILGDLAYHGSVFGFYYFIVEDVMKLKSPHQQNFDKNNRGKFCFPDDKSNVDYIVWNWNWNWNSELSQAKKEYFIENLIEQCRRTDFYLHALFEKKMIHDITIRYYLLKKLYTCVLSLQHTWTILLDDYE